MYNVNKIFIYNIFLDEVNGCLKDLEKKLINILVLG